MSTKRVLVVAALGALATGGPSPARAAERPAALPTVSSVVTAAGTTARPCHVGLLPAKARGVRRTTFTAPAAGAASFALSGAGTTDWDLAVYDASGREIGSSANFGTVERVATWVAAGDRLTLQACRRSGSGRARLSRDLVLAGRPKIDGKASLIKVTYRAKANIELLERLGFDVTERRDAKTVDVVVYGAGQLAKLRRTGLPFTTRVADLQAKFVRDRAIDRRATTRGAASVLPTGRTEYREYADYGTELKAIADENPTIVKPLTAGMSFQGRPLDGIEISERVNEPEDGRPVSLVVAAHHAREWPSAEIAMEYAHYLVDNYGKDPRVTSILKNSRVIVVPLVNPDGFAYSRGAFDTQDPDQYLALAVAGLQAYRRKTCAGAGPATTPCELQTGVDPNRNYGAGWGGKGAAATPESQTYRGTGPFSEPETQAIQKLGQTRQITNILTLHNVAALILRPPGRSDDGRAPDEDRLAAVASRMQTVSGYKSQFGFELYDTSGTTEDWFYAATGSFGYTIELGPHDGMFHMPYDVGVVKEWQGTGFREAPLVGQEGKGMRDLLLIAAEQGITDADHSVVAGRAPAGRTLRVKKAFKTETSDVCSVVVSPPVMFINPPLSEVTQEQCTANTGVQEFDDGVETTMVVPASGSFTYHLNPSTRPFKAKTGTESYTLTCEQGTTVLETKTITIARGERQALDLACGAAPPPPAEPTPTPPGPGAPAPDTSSPDATPNTASGSPSTTPGTTATSTQAASATTGRTCTSRRSFTIRLPKLAGLRVTLAGKRLAVRRAAGRSLATIDLRGRPRQTVTVKISGRSRGRAVTQTRRYRTCT